MRLHEKELKVIETMFLYAHGPLECFSLPEEQILALLDEPEFNQFSPEFRNWVLDQFDRICICQGQ